MKEYFIQKRKIGMTLVEVIVVVVISATLAVIAIPRYLLQVEIMKANEAKPHLTAVYQAQKDYARENDDGDSSNGPEFATSVSDLGYQLPTLKYFYTTPDVNFLVYDSQPTTCGTNSYNSVASLQSMTTGTSYVMHVFEDGHICCTPCLQRVCKKVNDTTKGCST